MVISLNIDAISRWVRMPADSFSSIRPFAPPLIQYWLDNPLVMGIWPDLHKGQLGTICPRSSSLSIFKGKAPLHFKHRQPKCDSVLSSFQVFGETV